MLHTQLSKKEQLAAILGPYQQKIESELRKSLAQWESNSPLWKACEYVMLAGGKRFRPALVYLIAKAVGKGLDVTPAALAIEFFHTTSLIADDLPCMDNEAERRNLPTVHRVYGEATALLVSYALISAGYGCLAQNAQLIKECYPDFAAKADAICVMALQNVTENTGILGAVGGQFLDLYPPDLTLETIQETLCKKTVTLFEIAFVLGWLFGGGNPEKLPEIKKAAYHFGMAYQVADDLGDMVQDAENQRLVNYATLVGKAEAEKKVLHEVAQFRATVNNLNIDASELVALVEVLSTV